MEEIMMAAPVPLGIVWRKSSYSLLDGCVEVARGSARVLVRNSNDPDGVALPTTAANWVAFLATVRVIAR